MSFRAEDRQKNNCPSRGLGLAAAAVGVGVGAALYYFFSRRQENPCGEGSRASAWQTNTFGRNRCNCHSRMDDTWTSDSYSTISENETSDTSMHTDNNLITSNSDTMSVDSLELDISDNEQSESMESSYSDFTEWDVTDSSMHTTSFSSTPMLRRITNSISSLISPRRGNHELTEEEQMEIFRQQAYRERNWVTEECSICFEVIQRSQEVMTLPCSHNFHQACILPWLQEQQTCPNCRKRTE